MKIEIEIGDNLKSILDTLKSDEKRIVLYKMFEFNKIEILHQEKNAQTKTKNL